MKKNSSMTASFMPKQNASEYKIQIVAMTIVLFFLLAVGMITSYIASTDKKIDAIHEYLKDVKNNIENTINFDLYGFLHNNLEKYMKLSSFSLFFLIDNAENDFFTQIKLELIDNQMLKSNIIKEIVFYRTYDDSIVSTHRGGFSLELQGTSYSDVAKIVDRGEFLNPFFILSDESKLIYLYPVIDKNSLTGGFLGFAALYINPTGLFASEISNKMPDASLLVLNSTGEFCSVQGRDVLSSEVISEILVTHSESANAVIDIYSSKYYFAFESGTSGLKYIYYSPTSVIYTIESIFDEYGKILLIYIAAIVVLCSTFLFLLKVRAGYKKSDAALEPNTTDEMTKSFKNVIDLLYGNTDINVQQYTLMEYFGDSALSSLFSVCITRSTPEYMSTLTSLQRQNFDNRMLQTTERFFSGISLSALIINHPQNCITSVILIPHNFSIEDIEKGLYLALHNEQEIQYSILISPPSSVMTDIQKNFAHMLELIQSNREIDNNAISGDVIDNHSEEDDSGQLSSFDVEQADSIASKMQGKSLSPLNQKYMYNVISFIEDNIQHVTLSLAAERFNVSSAHLSRLFKECMDTNFSDYVTEKKLQKAAAMLKDNSDMTISDIAKALGYSTSHFSKKFKEKYDLTPVLYKKEWLLK